MIGVLVATHGYFGREIINSLALIAGHYERCEAVCLNKDDDVCEFGETIEQKIYELNEGEGVIVLVDVLGGSPSNVSVKCLRNEDVELVTGVNLPMLLQVLESREFVGLKMLVQEAIQAGTEGILDIRKKMGL